MHLKTAESEAFANINTHARKLVSGDDLRNLIIAVENSEVANSIPAKDYRKIVDAWELLQAVGTHNISMIAGEISDAVRAVEERYNMSSGISNGTEWY